MRNFRDELVRYITRNTLAPLLLAVPVLALLIWAGVGRAMAPLQRVRGAGVEAGTRCLAADRCVNTPREIHGLVAALNQLFGASLRRSAENACSPQMRHMNCVPRWPD
ncbi:MAG: hypothetical protein H6962_06380 [Chromatiaceae bacterium]|nr:hypothetical protein [Chromatiaceae bacterium]